MGGKERAGRGNALRALSPLTCTFFSRLIKSFLLHQDKVSRHRPHFGDLEVWQMWDNLTLQPGVLQVVKGHKAFECPSPADPDPIRG